MIASLLLVAGLPACGASTDLCEGRRTELLYAGRATSDELALPEGQLLAIGALEDSAGKVYCSATLVAPGHVLTAGHCPSFQLSFRTGSNDAPLRSKVLARVDHADRDLALLVVDQAPLEEAGVVPIPLVATDLDASWVNTKVTLAGFGADERGVVGTRLFLREAITRLEEDRVEVNGKGLTGACAGDSGGPALAADERGAVQLIGALSVGEPSCRGRDLYERVDTQRAWFAELLPRDDCTQ